MSEKKPVYEQILEYYKNIVEKKHSGLISAWPVLSGCNTKVGTYKNWLILILVHTGISHVKMNSGFGEITESIIGTHEITLENKKLVRSRIEKHFKVDSHDAVLLLEKNLEGNWDISDEMEITLLKHEFAMGKIPMRIFLSHKGADKPLVREFKATLELLGFSPWLDEDAMHAGSELDRSILNGFSDSCAAVFFITPNYIDENFLATEVDYALQEKRRKGDKFSIITLVFHQENNQATVPNLLHRYVWKQPKDNLEALREIVKALPVQTGDVYWR